MSQHPFIEKIKTRHIIWLIGFLVVTKMGCRRLFPDPADPTRPAIIREAADEDQWLTKQQPLANADYRYREATEDNDTALLYREARYAYFSTRYSMDYLELLVRGKRLLTATATFSIRQPNGTIIYTVTGPAVRVLCPAYYTDLVDQEEAVKREITHFFDRANFLFPALNQDERYDARIHTVSHEEFDAIWHDDQLNGFMFNSFAQHETRVKIYYSRTDHRVKVYYRCCDVSDLKPLKQ